MFISRYKSNDNGMTLVEILVSLIILGLVLMAVFPLLTQGLQVTNLSNSITSVLFGDQEDIEIVAATNGGIYFADGTFIPQEKFKVFFGSEVNPFEVLGTTVKKGKLVRFLASIAHIKVGSRYEGYTPTEAVLDVSGYNTNFINTTKTVLLVNDKNGNNVTAYCSYTVIDKENIKLTLPKETGRFTSENSPYFITLTTGNERVTALLPIYLPRAIVVKSNRDLLVSADIENLAYWVGKPTSSNISHTLNKVIFFSTGVEEEASFIAVGNGGSIYLWSYGKSWERLNKNFCNGNMNYIINSDDGLIAVGDQGVIYTSNNGIDWTLRNSHTTANLKAIAYFKGTDTNKYICVGNEGVILTSSDAVNWQQQNFYPKLAENIINGHKAVRFSGDGEYLKTAKTPVTYGDSRSVFMVVEPTQEPIDNNLLTMGSHSGFLSFRTADGKLVAETNSSSFHSNLALGNNTVSFVSYRYDSSNYSITLSLNGTESSGYIDPINTGDDNNPIQLGSDPLTRYTGPYPFNGLIAEVLVFDSTISDNRDNKESDPVGQYASDLDLINKYLSVKYDINPPPNIDNLYYPYEPYKDLPLPSADISWDDFPNILDPVIWLDASNSESLDLENNNQILTWKDYTNDDCHANTSGVVLNSVACSDDEIISGGCHRNLIKSSNASNWIQSNRLNPSQSNLVVEYSMDDMVFSGERFVALFNDRFGVTANEKNSIIASFIKNEDNWNKYGATSSSLNDIFYYPDESKLFVVGNGGIMLFSTDHGKQWNKITLGTNSDLLTSCFRKKLGVSE